ncbi:methionyl-tRNA formyltransferase [Candidatus Saccharibacteria bacterium]|nr:methionyl-tRNA formyltransferase [Candidatus Saccharibacteria bacterium]MBR2864383.1 methionyl-tRNA formyltransferase [Candidatus Saccharibacteria bacterium]
MTKPKIIFFGNGPLADYALGVLAEKCEIVFHARKKEDLEEVKKLTRDSSDKLYGILASYGVIIRPDILELFEPEGILNIHPSLLPQYRGPSPIETAIVNGDKKFGVSVMKLAKAMDAGDIYHQATFSEKEIFSSDELSLIDASDYKDTVYQKLSEAGARWITENLTHLPTATPQDDSKATFTKMLDKSLSPLNPAEKSAEQLLGEIRAFSGYPKSKYVFHDLECIIISAHIEDSAPSKNPLALQCHDGKYLVVDYLQPAGRKVMDAKSFLNGYCK